MVLHQHMTGAWSLKSRTAVNICKPSTHTPTMRTANLSMCSLMGPKHEHAQVVNTLRGAIKTGVLPHLLFYGPPGTGKTSTVLALARTLYGPDTYRWKP